MYDNNAKIVEGFSFKKGSKKINTPPMHIRIGNKDYIVILENDGKLNILDRKGKARTKVNRKLEVNLKTIFYFYKNSLTFKDSKGIINRVNIATGAIEKVDVVNDEAYYTKIEKIKVTLNSNVLKINDKSVTLDFGTYTKPKIFYVNNKYFITTTDIEAKKVYIFNSKLTLLPKFPVYGQSSIDFVNADNDSALEFVVQGENNSILIYEIN